MATRTLAQLCNAVRKKGEYDRSATYTNAFLTEWVNEAIGELRELVSDQFQGHYDITTELVTVAATQTVNLPAGFLNERAIDRKYGTDQHAPLRRITLGQSYGYQGRGAPLAYMLHGGSAPGTIRLFPVPDAIYTLRLTYEPVFSELVADADSQDFGHYWEDLVHQRVLLQCDMREGKDTRERWQKIRDAEARIRSSASKRNSAEPEYLTDWNATPHPLEDLL